MYDYQLKQICKEVWIRRAWVWVFCVSLIPDTHLYNQCGRKFPNADCGDEPGTRTLINEQCNFQVAQKQLLLKKQIAI